ncbi:hypothetical protein P154DRAFT_1282 [Amniculicola lignicola CBS 123094]|uniref:ARID domain-containing protein n=1 Tax=Amniculicola lignicola CBS 123094 TaxID=1392246 RepID=A0A6A5X445_9PLEO|nr:hypothetical protein P154DRAFT_1282 [Amniculicola lignicola CBS 123094]
MDFQSPQNGMYDPSSFVDPSAIANSQMNGTRSYPVSSIPQKRDSAGAALSRSQTPSQQPPFGFQQQQAFSHTPSPTLQNQHFRPGQGPPQRMQTVSPAQNPNAPQMSPMGFAQGSPMPPGYDPNAMRQMQVQPIQLSHNLQSRQDEANRQYTMRLQAQHQHLAASNMAARQHQVGQMPGAMPQQPGMMRNMNPQQQLQNRQQQLQSFLKNVGALMAQNGRPFNAHPQIAGRVIDMHQLYWNVLKQRGYRYVTQSGAGGWPRIAQTMGIDLRQFPTAAEELRITYEQNLILYEQAYMQRQQQMKGAALPQGQMGAIPGMGQQMSPTRPTPPAQNPGAAQQAYIQQLQKQKAMQQQRQMEAGIPQQQPFDFPTPTQNNPGMATMNGRSTPQVDGKLLGNAAEQQRKSLSRQLEATPPQSQDPAQISMSPGVENLGSVPPDDVVPPATATNEPLTPEIIDRTLYKPATRTVDSWGGMEKFTHTASEVKDKVELKMQAMPNMPSLREMGTVDIRAITMGIRSALHAEARLALDTLALLTYDATVTLELEKCEDLVDVLVDYGEAQLEKLADDNPEVTDILDLTPYEDVIQHCHVEVHSLQDLPEYGTKKHDLERTADRILAITTILRNLSFHEINHALLASESVMKFLSNAIRLVGTRVLLLRSHVNTFDFMKDLITFFSNTSTKIVLPSREDAYTILHFICAFAPCPRPGTPVRFTSYNPKIHRYLPSAVDSLAKLLARDDPNRTYYKQIFANEATSTPPYDLLTRAFALAISLVPDRTSSRLGDRGVETRIADVRKPFLMQGMLAGDILAGLAPGPDSGVCRSWLESEDGWAASLLKFSMNLCTADALHPPPAPHEQRGGRGQQRMDHDAIGFQLIVHRALSMLKRLGEKSKGDALVKGVQTNGHAVLEGDLGDDEEDEQDDYDGLETVSLGGSNWKVNADFLPKKETLLGALLTSQLDSTSLRQFCGIGYLDIA